MLLLDVNILIAAHRADHPEHNLVRPWFDQLLDGDEQFGTPVGVWTSFLRITTNRKIFKVVTPLTDAFEFLDAICSQPNHLLLFTGPRHLELVKKMCVEADAKGDLVPDAVIAAIALEHSCTIVSLDRDFALFSKSVKHILPKSI